MKVWIKTKVVGSGTQEDPKRPYLSEGLAVSAVYLEDGSCLARVAGMPEQINRLLADEYVSKLTDDEARKIIKSKYPDSDLENVDVADPEVDEIAKSLGLSPEIRADVVVPSVGCQVLQDQERYLLSLISAKLGLTEEMWDSYARKKFGGLGIDIDRSLREGKNEVHEAVLNIIREAKKARDEGHTPMFGSVRMVCRRCGCILREL